MREILFRGKRIDNIDNGEWVEGYLRRTTLFNALEAPHRWRMAFVIEPPFEEPFTCEWAEVDPATVGQYTGLTDKNGKRIFEGDIVKAHYANVPKADFVEKVVFHNGRFCSLYQKGGAKMWCLLADGVPHHPEDKSAYMEWCEVIGNIHDNPDLLELEEV